MMSELPKILIVDDDESVRQSLTALLNTMGYPSRAAADDTEAFRHLSEFNPNIVLLDIQLGRGADGVEIARKIKGDPARAAARIIMMTGSADQAAVERAVAAGAADYIAKPFKMPVLMQKLIKHSAPTPSAGGSAALAAAIPPLDGFRILVVDDEEDIRRSMTAMLLRIGFQADSAPDALRTIKLLRAYEPHIILMDINLQRGLDGIELARRIKEDRANARIKIIMLTVLADKATVEKSLAAGAVDYAVKPSSEPILKRKLVLHLLGAQEASKIRISEPKSQVEEIDATEDEPETEIEADAPERGRRGSGLASERAGLEGPAEGEE